MPVQMTYSAHARAVLVLGLPLIGGHLAQFAIGMTDTLMMGWYSVEGLATLTIATSLFFSVFIVGSGFAWAVMPMVASAHAAGEETQVRRVTRMALWASIGFGALMMPLLWWSEPVLLLLGQEAEISALSQDYLRIAGWGIFPGLGVMVLKSYLAALGRTQVVFWLMLGSAALNVPLNYLLIFGNYGFPELGIQGAAIASVTLNMAGLVALILYIRLVTPEHALFQRLWRLDRDALVRVFRLGWPIGLTNLAEVGLFAASAIMVGWLGTIPLAAHGVAIQIASATFMVHMGLSNAATVRAGSAFGRKDETALRRGGVAATALSLVFALLTMAVYLIWPEPLIGAFLHPNEPARLEIVPLGAALLVLAAAFQLVDAAQVMALGLLRGVQDTRVPMVWAAFGYWAIGAPASYVLGFVLGYGAQGVWAGLVIGLSVAAIALMQRFWRHAVRIDTAPAAAAQSL